MPPVPDESRPSSCARQIKESLPVLFLSEVFELALYGKMLGAGSHMIAADKILTKVKEA